MRMGGDIRGKDEGAMLRVLRLDVLKGDKQGGPRSSSKSHRELPVGYGLRQAPDHRRLRSLALGFFLQDTEYPVGSGVKLYIYR